MYYLTVAAAVFADFYAIVFMLMGQEASLSGSKNANGWLLVLLAASVLRFLSGVLNATLGRVGIMRLAQASLFLMLDRSPLLSGSKTGETGAKWTTEVLSELQQAFNGFLAPSIIAFTNITVLALACFWLVISSDWKIGLLLALAFLVFVYKHVYIHLFFVDKT